MYVKELLTNEVYLGVYNINSNLYELYHVKTKKELIVTVEQFNKNFILHYVGYKGLIK